MIKIIYNIKKGPWGGGNQFLRALKEELVQNKLYTEKIENADIILFNSHHHLNHTIRLKFQYPKKVFIHRVDGPIFSIRNKNLIIDKFIFRVNKIIADGTIFQSNFSFKKSQSLFLKTYNKKRIIINAPSNVFSSNKNNQFYEKPTIIINSWSPNFNKGFKTYQFLDENLNFNEFEVKFVGNSPIKFKNIKNLGPLNTDKLITELLSSNIYLTASVNDPCSNSLIEAIHCGLIPVALNSGGHPEIVKDDKLIFDSNENLVSILKSIKQKQINYTNNLNNIEVVAKEYYFFSKEVKEEKTKNISKFEMYLLLLESFILNFKLKVLGYINK